MLLFTNIVIKGDEFMNIRALMAQLVKNNYTTLGLANLLGISRSTVYRKISGQVEFTRAEIAIMRDAFSLDSDSLIEIFFEDKTV